MSRPEFFEPTTDLFIFLFFNLNNILKIINYLNRGGK